MSPASLRGVSVLGELCCCLLCVLPLCTVLASPCFMSVCECVCMFMRGRARMGIVHGLWGVSSLGSLGGQLGGDCKYSVCMWVCVCLWVSQRERHSCGIVSRPAGRHQDNTNTHRFTTFSFILPFPWPLSPSLSPLFFLPLHLFPLPSISLLLSVPLHLLICVLVAVVSGGRVRKQSKGISRRWVYDPVS